MITHDRANEKFIYDVDTGKVLRRTTGKEAGTSNGRGYTQIFVDGKRYVAHRIAWLLNNKEFPNGEVDHIDGDTTNNRMDNLRVVDRTGNNHNTKMPKSNTSGIMGVSRQKAAGKWQVAIQSNGESIFLGLHDCILMASLVRQEAEIYFDYHPNHGR